MLDKLQARPWFMFWAAQNGVSDPAATLKCHLELNTPPADSPLFAYRVGVRVKHDELIVISVADLLIFAPRGVVRSLQDHCPLLKANTDFCIEARHYILLIMAITKLSKYPDQVALGPYSI
jgi:hypothetical protein